MRTVENLKYWTFRRPDAGNPASTELFHLPECTLFYGMAVVYLRRTGGPGRTRFAAESAGLRSAVIELPAGGADGEGA